MIDPGAIRGFSMRLGGSLQEGDARATKGDRSTDATPGGKPGVGRNSTTPGPGIEGGMTELAVASALLARYGRLTLGAFGDTLRIESTAA
jgi:hypothetical protein